MTRARVKLAGLCVVAAGVTGLFLQIDSRPAAAATSEAKLAAVQANCDVIQTRLRGVQKTDLTARIKRGRAYDQEVVALIMAFNTRLEANGVEAPKLFEIADKLQQATSASEFGELYTIYSDDLSSAIASDCETYPATTYGWIEKARVDRAALAGQVDTIDALISDYIKQLQELKKRFTPIINKPQEPRP